MIRGKCQAEEWLLLCIPWTENQETRTQSQAPLLTGESPHMVAQMLPPGPGPQCLWWRGELPYGLWEQRLPRNDREVECVVRKRRDLLRARCEFKGDITKRLASWLSQFFPVALQESQDLGQMEFAAKELFQVVTKASSYISEGEMAGSIP